MTKVATKFAGANPFIPKVRKESVPTNLETLTIAADPIEVLATARGKYDDVFDKLEPGQCIICGADEVNKISHAMRRWIRLWKNGVGTSVQTKNYKGAKPGTPTGRVWWVVE